MDINTIERVRITLLDQADLFDDAASYAAGVEDALDALARVSRGEPATDEPLTSVGGWFG